METIWLTDTDDDNTVTRYLTDCADLLTSDDADSYPGTIVFKIITHGMYVGSHEEWNNWIKREVTERLPRLGFKQ